MRCSVSAVVLMVFGFLVGESASGQTPYIMTDHWKVSSGTSIPSSLAINDAGQICGSYHDDAENDRAFFYDGGTVSDLGTLGGDVSYAWDINDSGHIVGGSDDEAGTHHAFLWQDGVMTNLAPDEWSRAGSINNAGQILLRKGDWDESFLWDPENGMQGLPIGAGDITDSGVIAGKNSVNHACLWEDGNITDLGTLGGEFERSSAGAVNSSHVVVGSSYTERKPDGSLLRHAVLWEDGEIIDLGAMLGEGNSRAFDVNDAGQVVGDSAQGGFLYDDGEMHYLKDVVIGHAGPWKAKAINESGQIAGWTLIGGDTHGCLLTPVPEPSSCAIALIGAGAVGLIAAARRRRKRG